MQIAESRGRQGVRRVFSSGGRGCGRGVLDNGWRGSYLPAMDLVDEIRACRLCAPRFALTATAHQPRPVVWFRPGAGGPRLLIVGQAPGARVHASGRPFTDPSGDRLRAWTGLSEAEFYDLSRVAVVPMAFCFPGYDAKGSDLPPPAVCARTWRGRVSESLTEVRLTLLVGGAAMRWYLGAGNVTETVAAWCAHLAAGFFPLPHPSWRNTGWLKRNPWFETDLLPELRARIRELLETP
ncbi:Uracil DNA glycosylase superfamily protein [Pseudogemmobacter humi]|uniref:Uracil DNA glycosylase superfamily protein n=2 Tax=Pseudogemmobacter humi TaxID=2483812 RepID=A0A3P5XF01_9RHOB|nr:Uracil DNA glycosylase superfamily protein [Pseudogemmobacter humi]